MSIKSTRLVSFDATEGVDGRLARPERYRDLFEAARAAQTFIARGSGLSYAAASMGQDVVSIDMKRFNRILAFDAVSGQTTVEPGITVGELIEFLTSRGFCLPVVPGYPAITVGGCVAFDVHGKSQFHSGNFGEWVTRLELFHPAHGPLACSASENPDTFELTIGGLGLTGMITRVELKTLPLPGPALRREAIAAPDLLRAVELMETNAESVDSLYSWHNLSRSGANFGSGLVFTERFVDEPTPRAGRAPWLAIGSRFPIRLWNRASTPLILAAYERLQLAGKGRVLGLQTGYFPIAGLEPYYAAFGAKGFREYQVILPRTEWAAFVDELRGVVTRLRVPVTLASLKLFKGAGKYLRFRGTGVCLAVDAPAGEATLQLFSALDELALRFGGCVNIAKDSRIAADTCRALFPEYGLFRERIRSFDPEGRCRSRLRERLDV